MPPVGAGCEERPHLRCGAGGMCPNYTSTPDWRKLRKLSDKWVTGLMEMCPGCDEEGDKIYEELVA